MQQIGVWLIADNGPQLAKPCQVDLEQHLEGWIATNPDMVQHGLQIVGRQLRTEAGPLDLLALDTQGRWVVIEVKRGRLRRETVAQALDYASCVAQVSFGELRRCIAENDNLVGMTDDALLEALGRRQAEETDDSADRDVVVLLVGTGMAPGLERIVGFLSNRYQMPIELVTFNAVEIAGGQRLLVRELAETEGEAVVQARRHGAFLSVDEILAKADQDGVGETFRSIHEAACRNGLAPRPYKRCIMYVPPTRKTRCLFAVWLNRSPGKPLVIFPEPKAFEEFYGVSEERAVELLGGEDYHEGTPEFVAGFIAGLDSLFRELDEDGDEPRTAQNL